MEMVPVEGMTRTDTARLLNSRPRTPGLLQSLFSTETHIPNGQLDLFFLAIDLEAFIA